MIRSLQFVLMIQNTSITPTSKSFPLTVSLRFAASSKTVSFQICYKISIIILGPDIQIEVLILGMEIS